MPNYSNQLFQVVIEPFLKNIPCVSPADENKDVYQYIKIIPQTMKTNYTMCFLLFFPYRLLNLRFKLCSFYIKNIENNLNL